MEEAEYCDRIALIYKSHIIALGTPHKLIAQVSDEATMEDAFVALIQRSDDAEV
jgi:ABC-2 type transport system ATP-binding protein